MTLFLRNKDNRSIVDLELWVKKESNRAYIELESAIILDTYSKFLVENLDRKDEIISDFTEISDFRAWLWEVFACGDDPAPEDMDEVKKFVSTFLKNVAKKYQLYYVED